MALTIGSKCVVEIFDRRVGAIVPHSGTVIRTSLPPNLVEINGFKWSPGETYVRVELPGGTCKIVKGSDVKLTPSPTTTPDSPLEGLEEEIEELDRYASGDLLLPGNYLAQAERQGSLRRTISDDGSWSDHLD